MDKRILDITGKRFNRLTAVRLTNERTKSGACIWEFLCDCGKTIKVDGVSVRSGHTKSCGCLQPEQATKIHTKHGLSRSSLYSRWRGVIDRCHGKRPDNKHYKDRGIIVCEEWRNDFAAFAAWAFTNGFSKNLQIDRIDNDGNYCPENCRWITHVENKQNTRQTSLYPELVKQIRQLYEMGEPLSKIAKRFNKNLDTVSSAAKRKTWKNI